jgi:hypothetical protein
LAKYSEAAWPRWIAARPRPQSRPYLKSVRTRAGGIFFTTWFPEGTTCLAPPIAPMRRSEFRQTLLAGALSAAQAAQGPESERRHQRERDGEGDPNLRGRPGQEAAAGL